MTDCQQMKASLSSYLDRALAADARVRVEQHLATCTTCQDHYESLVAVRHATEMVFAQDIASAPPLPAELESLESPEDPSSKKGSRRMAAALSSLGLVAASMTLGFILWPVVTVSATPEELLQRASARYGQHGDLEFLITPESEALDLLGTIFGSDEDEAVEEESTALDPFALILGRPNRILLDPDPTDEGVILGKGIVGFDGEQVWHYEVKEDTIVIEPGSVLETNGTRIEIQGSEVDLKSIDFLAFLTSSFVEGLGQGSDSVTEVTGPYERRVGHRALEFDLRAGEDEEDNEEPKKKKLLKVMVRVVIDPRSDLIEKIEFDLSLGGLSLVKLRAELIAVNQGYTQSFFQAGTHAKPTTRIRHDQPENPDPPEQPEKPEDSEKPKESSEDDDR